MMNRYAQIEQTIAEVKEANTQLLNGLKEQIRQEYKKKLLTGIPPALRYAPEAVVWLDKKMKALEILTKPRTVYEVDQIATMRGTEVDKLSDIVMMQVTVDSEDDCALLEDLIH